MRTWNLIFLVTASAVGVISALGVSDVAVGMIQALFVAGVALEFLSIAGRWRHSRVRAGTGNHATDERSFSRS